MPHHGKASTFWAPSPLRLINRDLFVLRNIQEDLARGFARLVNLLQLKSVEPDSSAASFADINHDLSGDHLNQLILTRWAFHLPYPFLSAVGTASVFTRSLPLASLGGQGLLVRELWAGPEALRVIRAYDGKLLIGRWGGFMNGW